MFNKGTGYFYTDKVYYRYNFMSANKSDIFYGEWKEKVMEFTSVYHKTSEQMSYPLNEDASNISILIVQNFYFKAMRFTPAGIHPHEHWAPVLRLCSTRTRMDFKYRIHVVIRLI